MELINETDYNRDDVLNQIRDNENKIEALLVKDTSPEGKQALALLKQNKKLMNRKGYFDLTDDERKLKARRGNEYMDQKFNDANAGVGPMAKALNAKYAGKTYKSEYDEVTIKEITSYSGSIRIEGHLKSNPYESTLDSYDLREFPELQDLAKKVKLFNRRSGKRNPSYREAHRDLSDKTRQEHLKAKNFKY